MASYQAQLDSPSRATGSSQPNVGVTERGLSMVGGGSLILYGLRQGGGGGILLALLGGSLLYRGATGHCPLYGSLGISTAQPQQGAQSGFLGLAVPKPVEVHLETAITINRPAQELYHYWRQQENLPRFMIYIDSVTSSGNTRSHWVAKGPMDTRLEWDSEITADQPGERIAWHSLEGADINHSGEVRFQPAPGGRGTEVRLKMDIVPAGGLLGRAASFLKGLPEQVMHEDLRRFKQLMEAGEIPTTAGQSSGRAA